MDEDGSIICPGPPSCYWCDGKGKLNPEIELAEVRTRDYGEPPPRSRPSIDDEYMRMQQAENTYRRQQLELEDKYYAQRREYQRYYIPPRSSESAERALEEAMVRKELLSPLSDEGIKTPEPMANPRSRKLMLD